MKQFLTLALAALIVSTSTSTSTAGNRSHTVCVLRSRPVAIQPAPRIIAQAPPVVVRPAPLPVRPVYHGYHYPACTVNYAKDPVIYGRVSPRLHYVNPCLPNGYIGGLSNLPSNTIQIPPTFGKPGSYAVPHANHPSNAPHPAAPAHGAR
jgi:hypothetical protein